MAFFESPFEFDPFENQHDKLIEEIPDKKWIDIAKEVLGESEEARLNGIKALKEKAKEMDLKLPFLEESTLGTEEKVTLEDRFWLMVLRAGSMDPEQAFQVLINYLTIMNTYPHYFASSRPPTKVDLTFQQKIHLMLKHRDQYGRRVVIFRPGRWEPDKSHFNEVFCTGITLMELVAKETKTQIAGVTAVCDADGFGFKQLRHFTIENARVATRFIQDSFPLWIRTIHIINAPRVFYLAYNIVRPFLNERVRNSIIFHSSYDSLFEQVPKEILPEELGGKGGPFDNHDCAQAVFKYEYHYNRVHQMVQDNKHLYQ